MNTEDKCCTIVPYFKIHDGKESAFRELCDRLITITSEEPGCLYYGFSFSAGQVHCREGYKDADALLAHVGSVTPLIHEALTISDLTRLEVHGPAGELDKLREPLAPLNPEFWVLEYGFRN